MKGSISCLQGMSAEAQEAESLAAAMEAVEAAEGDAEGDEDRPLLAGDEPLTTLKPMWLSTKIVTVMCNH